MQDSHNLGARWQWQWQWQWQYLGRSAVSPLTPTSPCSEMQNLCSSSCLDKAGGTLASSSPNTRSLYLGPGAGRRTWEEKAEKLLDLEMVQGARGEEDMAARDDLVFLSVPGGAGSMVMYPPVVGEPGPPEPVPGIYPPVVEEPGPPEPVLGEPPRSSWH